MAGKLWGGRFRKKTDDLMERFGSSLPFDWRLYRADIKAGRLYGNLISVLVALKGLPLAYNRDLQEDKEPLFDSLDTVRDSLAIMAGVVRTLNFNAGTLEASAEKGFSSAPDLAEYLVEKRVPFHQAHRLVGELVSWAIRKGRNPEDITLEDLRRFSPSFDGPALELMTPLASNDKSATGSSRKIIQVKAE